MAQVIPFTSPAPTATVRRDAMEGGKNGQELEEFYGDSDADENPFEPGLPTTSEVHGIDPSATSHLSDVPKDGHSRPSSVNAPPSALPTMGANVAHGLYWQGISGNPFPPRGSQYSFPPLTGTNVAIGRPNQTLSDMVARRARPMQDRSLSSGAETMGTEVETETEGETECDDSASEGGNGRKTSTMGEWAAHAQDWTALVDEQLSAAKAGRVDPHAMRFLLRKAGFIPSSRRKDVWRLLILGRVEPGTRRRTSTGFPDSPSEILALEAAILCTDLDLDNQRVVRVDVERTRPALEQFKRPRVKNLLTRVLTHHCKTHGLGYKQGMHEVLAPFVALSDPELPTSDISLCYGAFIKRFLPYAFNKDEEFLSLQICFRLFRILLLYHNPRLCRFLDQYQLQPELYATPWFLTLFANSLDLPRLYEIWDFYLYWGDPALHHFVVLAFVIGNAEVILQAEEANLPETMCRLSVGMRSVEEVRVLLRTAKELMLNTPKSFRKILRSALYANLSQSQMNLVLSTLQVCSCIPVSAEEVISYILHKNPHRQLDQESDQESVVAEDNGHPGRVSKYGHDGGDLADERRSSRRRSLSPQRLAERAAMRSLRGHRQYIIMDCRPREEFEAFRLAPALHLDPDLLESPDDLDKKLKEFMPLQGVAHFCLVGAGDRGAVAGIQKIRTTPSDLSGEAMGLRPTTSANQSERSKGEATAGNGVSNESGSRGDWSADGTFSLKGDGSSSVLRDKDGGFSWMEGLSRALARGHEGVDKDGEEVGREEDVQVARFVLMLLQYNFPFISHVRGDMTACLQELSAQAKDERDARHDTLLDGLLIGTDADRVREEVAYRSPQKKAEGMFAGFPKWPKGGPDNGSGAGAAAVAEETEKGRAMSWIGTMATDRGEFAAHGGKRSERTPSRGRGGLGRRGAEEFSVKGSVGADHTAEQKASTKRRLFSGVLDRFDRGESGRTGGGGGGASAEVEAEIGTTVKGGDLGEYPRNQDCAKDSTETRRWMNSGRSAGKASDEWATSSSEALGLNPGLLGVPAMDVPSGLLSSSLPSTGDNMDPSRTSSGTWVKPSKSPHPERFARFLGKMLGVRDDALPEGVDDGHRVVRERDEEVVRQAASRGAVDPVSRSAGGSSVEQTASAQSASTAARGSALGDGLGTARASPGAENGQGTRGDVPMGSTPHVTATVVYPATPISTATADAMPVAVAVAVPVSEREAPGTETAPSDRRSDRTSSRSRRSPRTANANQSSARSGSTARSATGRETPAVTPASTAVPILEWVANEQRETGGPVRMFAAYRVLDGKKQKRCRLAISPKNMTQFDSVQEESKSTGGTRGVISEHRGLRYLSRITSRKKHADLIVFHFKSRSGGASSSTSTSRSQSGASRAEASSRRTRSRPSGSSSVEGEFGVDPPDVLFYFMKEHVECLKVVKQNYRKVTQGGGSSHSRGSPSPSEEAAGAPTAAAVSVRRTAGAEVRESSSAAHGESSSRSGGRSTPRAAAAAAGAAGLVVGAAAGMAVGAATGVVVGAAYLAGHRKGANDAEERKTAHSSPTRSRRRGGGGGGGERAHAEAAGGSRGWIPIETGAAEGHGSGVSRRPSNTSASSTRRGASGSVCASGSAEHGREPRRVVGGGSNRKGSAGGPAWLG